MPYRIALLDDDESQRKSTADLSSRLLTKEGVRADIFQYGSAFALPSLSFDAYLLDISMPGIDGMAVAANIRATGSSAPVIFITGIENRVFEAIRLQPLRFVRKSHLLAELPEALHALADELKQEEKSTISIQTDGALLRIPVNRILYIESSDKYQKVVLADHVYEVRSTMAYFDEHLLPLHFMRIHRCYLVNPQAIYGIEGGMAALSNKEKLPISRSKLNEVKNEFQRMMFL